MDLIDTLIDWTLETKYDDLPREVIDVVKKATIDTLGTIIAGSSAAGCKNVVDLMLEWGGKEESSILVYGGRVPAVNASLANSTMARARDFDDQHERGGGHLSATFVPATLVLAEYAKRPISGRDFILALALGAEIGCRLRVALNSYAGWFAETVAPFGVVATGSKLLGFDRETMLNGMGIAYSFCSCNNQAALDGALVARVQQGIGARGGVTAIMLAQRGITGSRDVLQGMYGFYPVYAKNEYCPGRITDGLGKWFMYAETSLKPYPCCKHIHVPIYATLQLVAENGIRPEEIEEITVATYTKAYRATYLGDRKRKPENIVDAQFSIPYSVATAAIKGKVFIDDFTDESIRNPQVLEMAQKVKVVIDPEIDKLTGLVGPSRVEIRTKDGERLSKYVEYVKGHPKNPMTWEECVEKFKSCTRFSAKPLRQRTIAEIIQKVKGLEDLSNVTEIVKLLTLSQ